MFGKQFVSVASLLLAAALPGALAVPDVTAVPIGGGCAAYPDYNADSGNAGPWLLKVVNSGNASIEGFGDTVDFSRGATGIRWGYITFPTNNQLAKCVLQCTDGNLQGLVPTGVSSYSWQTLNIAPYPYDASLIYLVEGSPVVPFNHYIDGVLQDGVFLGGYDNSTTWGLRYEPASDSAVGDDFFYARLLGPDSADPSTGEPLFPGEFTAFIQVNA